MIGRRLHPLAAGLATAAMVAYPAAPRGGTARRALSTVVVGSLFATTGLGASRRWGPARAGLAALIGLAGTGAAEHIGVSSGRPFGRYSYTGALRPQLGGVPVIVPMAWCAMALPAREAAHAALGDRSSPVRRVVAGAVALTAWDLFLDPQMVGEGYWAWERVGRYRTVPLSNFVGWFAVGAAAMAVLEVTLPPGQPSPALVAEYAGMASMETIAFAAFFRDPLVATVGGAAMLPVAGTAVARLVGQRT